MIQFLPAGACLLSSNRDHLQFRYAFKFTSISGDDAEFEAAGMSGDQRIIVADGCALFLQIVANRCGFRRSGGIEICGS